MVEIVVADQARGPWVIGPGEEARLTPEGPWAVVIKSRGPLPFVIPNTTSLHTHADFPGSSVKIDHQLYEVTTETHSGKTWEYGLVPWRDEVIVRRLFHYTPEFIHQVKKERSARVFQKRSKPFAWALLPFLGMLPEEHQYLVCAKFGHKAEHATLVSGFFEAAFWIVLFLANLGALGDQVSAGDASMALFIPIYAFFSALGTVRVLGAMMFKDPAGFWLMAFGFKMVAAAKPMMERLDMTAVPLTRAGFWARLRVPDRQARDEANAILIQSPLCHLDWEKNGRFTLGGQVAMVEKQEPKLANNQLYYNYRLFPMRGTDSLITPDAQLYQKQVRDGITEEWDALIQAFPSLMCLLPTAVQVRAVGARGGPGVWGKWPLITALIEVAPFSFKIAALLLGGEPLVGAGLWAVLFVDGCFRLLRVMGGQYAPSLLGYIFADWLPPERKAFQNHLMAERKTIKAFQQGG